MKPVRGLELLAPAKNAAIAREAILHGADAVYIGGPTHGARAAVANTIADIAEVVDFAHRYGARVYVTLNTIVYDDELSMVEREVHDLYRIGVDALIVQDMSLLRLDIPPIDLHASTQCDIRTVDKARFLASAGFSQLVLPRELSLAEITEYHRALGDVRLEAFVHGALCVSYSGDCQASFAACRRSANRGQCAQMCRLPYSLTDASGRVIVADKHLLSLRDLNRIADIRALADAGVSSFKIEGRLKDASYVKTVTAAYRRAIDRVIADAPDLYRRTSMGRSDIAFDPDLDKVFNRGFTSYFLDGAPANGTSMANFDTPKWVGEKVAVVTGMRRGVITADILTALNNGDGLGFFTPEGRYTGFRANRIEGSRIFPASKVDIAPGTMLYRNSDTRHEALMAGATATRSIDIDIILSARSLSSSQSLITITLADGYGHRAEVTEAVEVGAARSPQSDARRRAVTKLGDTVYRAASVTDNIPPDTFIPLSVLTALRRRATDALDADIMATHPYLYRRTEDREARYPSDTPLTYHDNVANTRAEGFYADHGATVAERALETQPAVPPGTVVMTTRYCLRREMGACLKTPEGRRLPSPLFLTNASGTYRLDFDCARCRMLLTSPPTPMWGSRR